MLPKNKAVIYMFWENFARLCNQVGKSPSRVAMDIGLSSTSVVGWKKGAEPRNSTMKQLADYFGVPVESLTADELPFVAPKMKSAEPETDESQLLMYFRQFNREGRGRMLDFAESMQRSGKYAVGANRFA